MPLDTGKIVFKLLFNSFLLSQLSFKLILKNLLVGKLWDMIKHLKQSETLPVSTLTCKEIGSYHSHPHSKKKPEQTKYH